MKWLQELFSFDDECPTIAESILGNLCVHCIDQAWERVAVTEEIGSDRAEIWGQIDGEWVKQGELPIEQNFLRRTRFVSNRKLCADLRLPANRTECVYDGRKFEVHIVKDVDLPTPRLEFTVLAT